MANESGTSSVSLLRQDIPVWLDSLSTYLKEVETNILNLECKGIGLEEVKAVLQLLSDSQISELILAGNALGGTVNKWSRLFVKTNIKTLNISLCGLNTEDFLCLMHVSVKKQMTNLDASASGMMKSYTEKKANKIVSLFLKSSLKTFEFDTYTLGGEVGVPTLLQVLPNTSITCLDISQCDLSEDVLISLFLNLRYTSVTDLDLNSLNVDDGPLTEKLLKELSRNLRLSKVEKLNLGYNNMDDDQIEILVPGFVHSKITDLDLTGNDFHGLNTLGFHLKETCIKTLNLSACSLKHHGIFLSPEFLRSSSIDWLSVGGCHLNEKFCLALLESLVSSKVTYLDVSNNDFQLQQMSKVSEVVKKSDLKQVNFSGNNLSLDALIVLGETIKESKLEVIDLRKNFKHPNGGIFLPIFLESLKNVSSICNNLSQAETKSPPSHLNKTELVHLDLSSNELKYGIISIAEHLKCISLKYLTLTNNEITDDGVEALARNLKETQLVGLYLGENHITSRGAKAVASCFKDSCLLYLTLNQNKIKNDGIQALAQEAENTFITFLDVLDNPGDRFLLVDAVTWKNKISVHHFVKVFKQIAPTADDKSFRFDNGIESEDVSVFLKNCLQLYKNFLEKPSAFSVLLEDASVSFSRQSIIALVDDFPKQFCLFAGNKIEADVNQHVSLLDHAENLGLNKLVELLLLNRPMYTIDKGQEILHPRVYQLLFKYNYPLYNLDIEPEGKEKIINYFTEQIDTEGASDVIRLVRGKRKQ